MAGAMDLIGALLQSDIGQQAQRRIRQALESGGGQEAGGSLAGMVGGLLGGGGGSGSGGMLSGLADAAGGLFGGSAAGAGGGGIGDLLGRLAGGDPRQAGGGAMAVLAGLASAAGLSGGGAAAARAPADPERVAGLAVRAMLQAAHADGRIDAEEQRRILDRVQRAGLDEEAQRELARYMQHPGEPEDLGREVPDAEAAAQVFAAALLAVEVDTAAEHDYLDRLRRALGLDEDAARRIAGMLGIVI